MEEAAITVFSVRETIGHKTEEHGYLPDNWFWGKMMMVNVLFLFSFTEDEKLCMP